MIKKRTYVQSHVRQVSLERDSDSAAEAEEEQLPLADLIELRKLRKAREGIDVTKLNKGVSKKKRKVSQDEEVDPGGLKSGVAPDDIDDSNDVDKDAKARKAVRSNNFTQQTNALDVDKHMLAYIEENLKVRSKPRDEVQDKPAADPQEALYHIQPRWNVEKKAEEEGSVTNSLSMLTAIPEVDLGMDTRLKNIEETEKAKRMVAEARKDRPKQQNNDEGPSRFYRPNLKAKSDADILRDAKLEAMGLPVQSEHRARNERVQMATDEMVMERFKKRMRK